MSEEQRDALTAIGSFGDVEIDYAAVDWLQQWLEKVLAPLEAEVERLQNAPELLAALVDLVEIERRDNLTDPDVTATDQWRADAWDNARAAIARAQAAEATP